MSTTSALLTLSNDLASAVERIAPSVVYVDADARRDASGLALDEHTVVTVDHAIDRDDEIEIVLAGNLRYPAELIGRDPTTDLALLRTTAALTPAPSGDAESLRVGHVVLALGRDEDGAIGASFGVASVVGGPWQTWRGGRIDRFLRPDLTLYAGFSGGPLVDASGAVLGLNTWGLSRRTALTIGLGTIERIAAQLREHGRIRRGYLGFAFQTVRLPEGLRARHDLAAESALMVVDVASGSPSDRAGLAIGDVILALGERTIEDARDLQHALGNDGAGATRPLRILRAGQPHELVVTIGERAA
jgi:S1-C subfamily serine protease